MHIDWRYIGQIMRFGSFVSQCILQGLEAENNPNGYYSLKLAGRNESDDSDGF